jgi:DinB superfamily
MLVEQLRFTRAEWQRALDGVSDDDARRRVEPMNPISWMIGHLAWHERLVWVERGLGQDVEPVLDAVANGAPASTPQLGSMWAAWDRIVDVSDRLLLGLTPDTLARPLPNDRRADPPAAGTELLHVIYHYWGHIGEASAIRQILDHQGRPEFVGDIDTLAPYRRDR